MEVSSALYVLSPVIGLAVNCCAHVAIARMLGPTHPYRIIVRASLFGLLVVFVIGGSLATKMTAGLADATASMIVNTATYAALSFGYFSFVNLSLTSLRIRMLQELRDVGGKLSLDGLHAIYDNDEMIAIRIKRLLDGGHLVQRENRLYSKPGVFLAIARLFDGLRWFILGNRSSVQPTRSRGDRKQGKGGC